MNNRRFPETLPHQTFWIAVFLKSYGFGANCTVKLITGEHLRANVFRKSERRITKKTEAKGRKKFRTRSFGGKVFVENLKTLKRRESLRISTWDSRERRAWKLIILNDFKLWPAKGDWTEASLETQRSAIICNEIFCNVILQWPIYQFCQLRRPLDVGRSHRGPAAKFRRLDVCPQFVRRLQTKSLLEPFLEPVLPISSTIKRFIALVSPHSVHTVRLAWTVLQNWSCYTNVQH